MFVTEYQRTSGEAKRSLRDVVDQNQTRLASSIHHKRTSDQYPEIAMPSPTFIITTLEHPPRCLPIQQTPRSSRRNPWFVSTYSSGHILAEG
jgi:hypothetical protein